MTGPALLSIVGLYGLDAILEDGFCMLRWRTFEENLKGRQRKRKRQKEPRHITHRKSWKYSVLTSAYRAHISTRTTNLPTSTLSHLNPPAETLSQPVGHTRISLSLKLNLDA
jgi:hypothetical protein